MNKRFDFYMFRGFILVILLLCFTFYVSTVLESILFMFAFSSLLSLFPDPFVVFILPPLIVL